MADLSSLNLGLTNYLSGGGDISAGLADTSALTTLVPDLYNDPAVYAAPTNSNNIGTAPAVNSDASFLDYLTLQGKRAVGAITDKFVIDSTTNHQAPGAVATTKPNPTQIVQGVPNMLLFIVGGFILYEALK